MADQPPPTAPPPSTGNSATDKFLQLVQDPFKRDLDTNAFWASLGTSIGITILLALVFSLIRPHNTQVYAPRLKSSDHKHAPPPLGKGLFAWVKPVWQAKETDLVDKIGLDAVIFLRFTRLCRNLFLVMSVVGCGVLIPSNIFGSDKAQAKSLNPLTLMTPLVVFGKGLWAQIICSYLFDGMICFALWRHYRIVLRLRRAYFESPEYQNRLHSRTLMVTDIPKQHRSDNGLYQVSEAIAPSSSIPRCVVGRNVQGLSDMIRQHEKAVRSLESVLAKYLKKPHSLPASRPTYKPKTDHHGYNKGQKVDAINYWTDRIRALEFEIKEARQHIDKKSPMPYGFISYDTMPEAHAIAYTARRKHPLSTSLRLAPTPEEIIWDNLRLTSSSRRSKRILLNFWVTMLTVVWIAPNALTAIFLANLSNLGAVWGTFQRSLYGSPWFWACVQGIASPAITALVYLYLPVLFRRLCRRAGDITKTSREMHVIHQLYAFFVFNNLVIFTAFSAIWQFVASVVTNTQDKNQSLKDAIDNGRLGSTLATALCNSSPFWVTYLLQRNLGAAIDLAQLVNLFNIWFGKTFMNLTPRQRFEWTRPPPFDYASYYNYFLFYATITLCFATLQPLVLPVTALYFSLDCGIKKYLLMYIYVTKTESHGQFWRVVFNRMIFAAILSNVAVALIVFAKEFGSYPKAMSMIPLPFLMLGFKFYCKKAFDDNMRYYSKRVVDAERLGSPDMRKAKNDKLGARFQNPALYKKLITPTVLDEAKDVLAQIYRGRLHDHDGADVSGQYGAHNDMNMLDSMSQMHPGKKTRHRPTASLPFASVPESHLDFSDPHNRAEFDDDYGRGELYGRPVDLVTERSNTPRSFLGQTPYDSAPSSRASSPGGYGRAPARGVEAEGGTIYPAAYHHPYTAYRPSPPMSPDAIPHGYGDLGDPGATRGQNPYFQRDESQSHLLHGAAPMPLVGSRENSPAPSGRWTVRSDASRGNYGGVPQHLTEGDEGFSYEEFRRGRR
ncbi:MAG: hypothetical protein M1817_000031 [Caeruleum heppii]|nr:MAG: hypothetical protein M1817_000031 [Caeruleum heppii]